ncbi:hypothetical protein ACSBR2_014679 [Camellia fascicularis]
MASTTTLLLVVVFVFDLIAFVLAVAAEFRIAKASLKSDADGSTFCVYDSNYATGLGVGSLLFLMVSQLLIMLATRCLCCGMALRPGRSRVWAIVLFVTCWVTFFIAEVCLLGGSVRNAYHTRDRFAKSDLSPFCATLSKGVFGAGAAFIVFTGIVSELFYVYYSKATNEGFQPAIDTCIRMGFSQFLYNLMIRSALEYLLPQYPSSLGLFVEGKSCRVANAREIEHRKIRALGVIGTIDAVHLA